MESPPCFPDFLQSQTHLQEMNWWSQEWIAEWELDPLSWFLSWVAPRPGGPNHDLSGQIVAVWRTRGAIKYQLLHGTNSCITERQPSFSHTIGKLVAQSHAYLAIQQTWTVHQCAHELSWVQRILKGSKSSHCPCPHWSGRRVRKIKGNWIIKKM